MTLEQPQGYRKVGWMARRARPGERRFADGSDPVAAEERTALLEQLAALGFNVGADVSLSTEALGAILALAQNEMQKAATKLANVRQQQNFAEVRSRSGHGPLSAAELVAFAVPEPPQFFCDDITPEELGRLLARQGGRVLQAGPEGTAFEIAKGRYSEAPNFDVYLKGHAGDPLRVNRVGRGYDVVDRPALSLALAVQPDVIAGLASEATLRQRGFLARFLYSAPASLVGG